jgi:cell division control protein 45
MTLQRAIVRQGSSIIDKKDIGTLQNHRIVILKQGPDLALFSLPGVLVRLAAWLVDNLRGRLPGTAVGKSKKKGLPFIVSCLDEAYGRYTVVGIMGALDFNQVHIKYDAFFKSCRTLLTYFFAVDLHPPFHMLQTQLMS